jgi:hypothetical protein
MQHWVCYGEMHRPSRWDRMSFLPGYHYYPASGVKVWHSILPLTYYLSPEFFPHWLCSAVHCIQQVTVLVLVNGK